MRYCTGVYPAVQAILSACWAVVVSESYGVGHIIVFFLLCLSGAGWLTVVLEYFRVDQRLHCTTTSMPLKQVQGIPAWDRKSQISTSDGLQ